MTDPGVVTTRVSEREQISETAGDLLDSFAAARDQHASEWLAAWEAECGVPLVAQMILEDG